MLPSTHAKQKREGRRWIRWASAPLCVVLLLAAQPALAYYIIGDSIGVGVGWAAPHSDSLAANSVRISSDVIFQQIAQVPRGSLVFVSLGTNDAVGYVVNVENYVQRIVDAASARNLTLVWIGPPCVFKDWDSASRELDQHLATQLGSLGITYASMRDPSICDRSVRGSDGVHFNMTGYQRLWSIAATAAGLDPSTGMADLPIPPPVPNPIRVAGVTVDHTTTATVTPQAPAPIAAIETTAFVAEPEAPASIAAAVLDAMAARPPPAPEMTVPIPMPRPPFVQQLATAPPIPIPNPIRQNVAIGY